MAELKDEVINEYQAWFNKNLIGVIVTIGAYENPVFTYSVYVRTEENGEYMTHRNVLTGKVGDANYNIQQRGRIEFISILKEIKQSLLNS